MTSKASVGSMDSLVSVSAMRMAWLPDQTPPFTFDDVTDSVGYFMSINIRHELHG
jgi:hypothetical protein